MVFYKEQPTTWLTPTTWVVENKTPDSAKVQEDLGNVLKMFRYTRGSKLQMLEGKCLVTEHRDSVGETPQRWETG